MITTPQGAERHQLEGWSTKRLLRYMASRRAIRASFRASKCPCYPGCSCGPRFSTEHEQTDKAMKAEIDFIKSILAKREHVK